MMLKIRILAGLISLVLTAATVYVFPIVYFAVAHWIMSLTPQQHQWVTWSQVVVGALLALVGFLQWKKKRRKQTPD